MREIAQNRGPGICAGFACQDELDVGNEKTGSIPPGATVWWEWRITDEAGRKGLTPRKEILYEDQRFDWRTFTSRNITIDWYDGGPEFRNQVASKVDASLSRLQLGFPTEKPIKAFIYSNSTDVQGAILFAQAWTGGLAFTEYNIVLIAISPDDLESGVAGLTHELAHLLVKEVTFNCLGRLPTWLNEGLAVYSEGSMQPFQRRALDQAIGNNALISIRSLSGSFPAGHTGAALSYAESFSLVEYLIDVHGWEKMRELLAIFSVGSTPDKALQEVYGFDRDGLEELWKQDIGVG